MDVSGLGNYLNQAAGNATSNRTDNVASSIGKLSSASSYEDLEEATKSFEAYLLEQTIKEVKSSVEEWNDDEDEDASMSQVRDMYMDQAIGEIAKQMVNQYGGRVTKDFTDQIARNYGIEIPDSGK